MRKSWLVLGASLAFTVAFAQQRDSRIREYLSPVRIIWQQDSVQIENEHYLLSPGNGQADLSNSRVCVMRSTDARHPALLLDFGKEIQGGIQLVTGMPASQKPVRIRVRFGESVSEAMCEIDGKNGATNDHAVRDFQLSLPWLGVAEVGNSGFRFVRIDLPDDSVELQLKEIRAIATYRDIPYKGSFRCSDERLNQIWQTGAYTVHLNLQEYLWDGIKRDRLVWIGDMHPEVMTVNTVFGYNEAVPKSLDLTRNITPLPNWMNGISSYSIWWLLIQRDWFRYQGDWTYLQSQKDYLVDLLKVLISKVDASGREHLDGMRFLDWPSNENPEAINAGLQALMVQAMKYGAELCSLLQEPELASTCLETEARLRKAAPQVIKPFLALKKKPTEPGMKQAAALLAWAGLMDANEADQNICHRKEDMVSLRSMDIICYVQWLWLEIIPERWILSVLIGAQCWIWGQLLSGKTLIWTGCRMLLRLMNWYRQARKIFMEISEPTVIKVSAIVCVMAGLRGLHRG